jgi:PAS domain S-box-containing protein
VANDLTRLIDTANAPIFGIDGEGLVNEWNRKAMEITGYSKDEVLGRSLVRDFITAEFQDSVQEVLLNALRGKETANFEFPLYTKDGEFVDILLNAATRRGPEGSIVGVVGVGQNITELKQEKVEMSRIAQDLMRLIDYANAPIFGIDTKGRVNEWNRKSVEITGFRREDVIGKNLVHDFITPDYQASVSEVLDNALQGKGTDNFEFPLYSRDGQKVEVLLNATTRVDAAGDPIGVIGVGQDITERKNAEQEVTRLAMDLQRLIDSANAPILGVDRNGLISEWNENICLLSGYSKQEVLGIRLAQCAFIEAENRASVADVLERALDGHDRQNFEFSIHSKDGKRVELLLNAATRRNASGAIVGVVGVGQDITEKKYIEKAQINAANA